MFDSLPDRDDGQDVSTDGEKSSWWIGRWAHVIAMVFFSVLYFPFSEHFWSWQLAIAGSYIVFILCCTCGLAFRDSDDFFGNLQVWQYLGKLLVRQILILILVSVGAYLWRYLEHVLPASIAQRGSRLSLWDLFGLMIAYVVAIREAAWMANKIKDQFPELKETF